MTHPYRVDYRERWRREAASASARLAALPASPLPEYASRPVGPSALLSAAGAMLAAAAGGGWEATALAGRGPLVGVRGETLRIVDSLTVRVRRGRITGYALWHDGKAVTRGCAMLVRHDDGTGWPVALAITEFKRLLSCDDETVCVTLGQSTV